MVHTARIAGNNVSPQKSVVAYIATATEYGPGFEFKVLASDERLTAGQLAKLKRAIDQAKRNNHAA